MGGYKKSGSGSSSSDKPKLGCVWDGTGCHDDDCDTMAMEDRCQKLSHDQGECEGDVGSYNRCVWSHGSQSKSRLNVLKAHKSNMKMMSRSSGQNNKQQNAKEKQMEEEIAPRPGCIWDLTGCAAGCDEQVMDQRCDRMSHDQEMCEGEIGVFNRCVWSHGSDSHMNVDIHFSDIGEDSTVDILLIVAGVVTAMFIIQQFYKWWRNREYKKVQETQHHEEIQSKSHSTSISFVASHPIPNFLFLLFVLSLICGDPLVSVFECAVPRNLSGTEHVYLWQILMLIICHFGFHSHQCVMYINKLRFCLCFS